MRGIEFAAADFAAQAGAQRAFGGLGIFARHQGADFRILAQRQDGLLGVGVGAIAAVGLFGDGGGEIAQPVLGAVLLHQSQPGLVDELEQAGGR